MTLDERQIGLLHSMRSYGKVKRYHGIMPLRVAQSLEESALRSLFEEGYVAYATFLPEPPQSGLDMAGFILTDKGCKALHPNS